MNSETKFTKGPWSVRFNDVWYEIKGASGEWISDTCASSCKGDLELGEANAHLIAAAPEMYEMLEGMAKASEHRMDGGNERIWELLAKARGESA